MTLTQERYSNLIRGGSELPTEVRLFRIAEIVRGAKVPYDDRYWCKSTIDDEWSNTITMVMSWEGACYRCYGAMGMRRDNRVPNSLL